MSNPKPASAEGIAPIDGRQYRSYRLTVMNDKPATANRKLAGISALCQWAREADLVLAHPAAAISPVGKVGPVPKWLGKNQQHALLGRCQQGGWPDANPSGR